MDKQRVVITGMGIISPLGNDLESTWQGISSGENGIHRITAFDPEPYRCQMAGEVKGFDAEALFGRKDARRMSRQTQFAMAAAGQAIAAAGLNFDHENRDRVGVLVGSGMSALEPVFDSWQVMETKGPNRVSPFLIPIMLPDTPGAAISIAYGLHGPNFTLATACATGNDSIGQAYRMIQWGLQDVILAGATEAAIIPITIAGFAAMTALSNRNEEPERASRPFDLHRDGFVPGEGAAILVLESLAHAQARGATIVGEVLGYGMTSDAYHVSAPAEDGAGAMKAMKLAMQEAGVTAVDIDYINAHGTSTPLNDKVESMAVKGALGDRAYQIPMSSTKSMTGHLLGATGALEAVFCLKAMETGVIPPTINYETPDPACDLDYVPNEPRQAQVNIAMTNAFGFGGHNSVLILGKFDS
ncbi:MAG: beta-ketoacyl-ACP synthase II [Chloroflexi bacterium]|nr:beta-ketoacyl-ACP synthase II [Ardenticatenaceae bacterium]MBL1127978.1 beta-ketoacyl-[acyl-carrier-protein] synthase II [Chloroflexota bacterium]NOG34050.1 beta-ketoacyl-ACP synthase II [Chloroflexota bacterium]GIK54468.1 MAG: 3-oxoacyl-[acyl-carrier-protein] synthase 2 [Chloroflexota bacterium]